MHEKANKLDILQTEPMMCEKDDSPPMASECMTRMMTPEDWEKYGPLKTTESQKKHRSITF